MFSNRIFQVAFLISLIAHGVILFQNPSLPILPINKKEQDIEVSYIKNNKERKEEPRIQPAKKELFPKSLSAKITTRKINPPPFIDKESIFKKNRNIPAGDSSFTKPAFIKSDVISVKKIITLPPIDNDKMNNPSYISYYQIVREKIRRAAYQNYSGDKVGEVYLSFVISKDGFLKEARLIDVKSSGLLYLRDIALKSIKDASPFPAFPKELDYPQLSFNVVISFQIES